MANQPLFVRLPEDVRRAVDEYVSEKGLTLGSGVADLLERGLEAAHAEASVTRLEQSLQEARQLVSQRDEEVRSAEARATAAEAREENLRGLVSQLDQAPAGRCQVPGCGRPFSAIDLVVKRQCPAGHPLTAVLEAVTNAPGLNATEALIALAAIGLLLGVVVASRRA